MIIKYNAKNGAKAGFWCLAVVVGLNAIIGGVASQYLLWYLLNKDIPWIADGIIGLIGGEIIVPASIVCLILSFCGVGPFRG